MAKYKWFRSCSRDGYSGSFSIFIQVLEVGNVSVDTLAHWMVKGWIPPVPFHRVTGCEKRKHSSHSYTRSPTPSLLITSLRSYFSPAGSPSTHPCAWDMYWVCVKCDMGWLIVSLCMAFVVHEGCLKIFGCECVCLWVCFVLWWGRGRPLALLPGLTLCPAIYITNVGSCLAYLALLQNRQEEHEMIHSRIEVGWLVRPRRSHSKSHISG